MSILKYCKPFSSLPNPTGPLSNSIGIEKMSHLNAPACACMIFYLLTTNNNVHVRSYTKFIHHKCISNHHYFFPYDVSLSFVICEGYIVNTFFTLVGFTTTNISSYTVDNRHHLITTYRCRPTCTRFIEIAFVWHVCVLCACH